MRWLSILSAFALLLGWGCKHTSSPSQPVAAATEPVKQSANPESQIAMVAGGCFWGMEELLRKLPGVLNTTVGYTGGTIDDPDYSDVKTGSSGHAESVRIEFDPAKISYQKVLEYFFTIHDPTTANRQGNDIGTQYRSAIFVLDDSQRETAAAVMQKVASSGYWKKPLTTQVLQATTFYPAEDYHQDYLQKNPGGYTCHYERDVSFY